MVDYLLETLRRFFCIGLHLRMCILRNLLLPVLKEVKEVLVVLRLLACGIEIVALLAVPSRAASRCFENVTAHGNTADVYIISQGRGKLASILEALL